MKKIILSIMVVFAMITITSCRETKKENVDTSVEEIQEDLNEGLEDEKPIEVEVDSLNNELPEEEDSIPTDDYNDDETES